jgi:hypothetical protein
VLLFILEMIAKIIALNLAAYDGAYLHSGWNCLDGFIAVGGLLSQLSNGVSVSWVRKGIYS